MISVLVADDHSIVRAGISLLINNHEGMNVIGEVEDGKKLYKKRLQLQPDVIIMDLNMPKVSGLVATKQINEANQDIKLLYSRCTMTENTFSASSRQALQDLLKSHPENDLIEAIRTVHRGEAYLYPNATRMLLEDYIQKSNSATEDNLMKLTV